jgi:preprotein translocase subunit YajC
MAPPALVLTLAQTAPSGGAAGGLGMFLPLILIVVVFYFFILRPQSQREKARRSLIDAVKKGDKVITAGGIHGTVTNVDETSVLVQVDANVKLRFEKNAISSVTS